MKIAVGSDHAGFELKERVKRELEALGHTVEDVGTHSGTESVDYPDFAIAAAERVASGAAERGVVICATGIGASIAANKVPGVRAALVTNADAARLTRQDNDSNVIALAGRSHLDTEAELEWLRLWLEAPFAGGRHQRRVDKISSYERERAGKE